MPEASVSQPPDLIVVPARYGSTRLPGKPLAIIAGHTLLERVAAVAHRAVMLAGNAHVVVATDDERIAAPARALGCTVAMTERTIASGSGRAFATAAATRPAPGIVLNLQGDAPFVPAETVAALLNRMRETTAAVATPVVRLSWAALDALRTQKLRSPFSGTTCTRGADGRALWFSKAVIPAMRNEATLRASEPISPVYRHLGLYAYRMDALQAFERTPPSPYEQLEGLEQLRFLEMGLRIETVVVDPPRHAMSGIDTPDDLLLAEALIAEHGDPFRPWH